MEVKIDFKWTQMDANGMFRMSAERHEIIITGWHITRKTIKSLKKTVKRDRKPVWEESSLYNQKQNDSEKAQRFESHWLHIIISSFLWEKRFPVQTCTKFSQPAIFR